MCSFAQAITERGEFFQCLRHAIASFVMQIFIVLQEKFSRFGEN